MDSVFSLVTLRNTICEPAAMYSFTLSARSQKMGAFAPKNWVRVLMMSSPALICSAVLVAAIGIPKVLVGMQASNSLPSLVVSNSLKRTIWKSPLMRPRFRQSWHG